MLEDFRFVCKPQFFIIFEDILQMQNAARLLFNLSGIIFETSVKIFGMILYQSCIFAETLYIFYLCKLFHEIFNMCGKMHA